MSSNLKVNTILPSTGTAIGIGTASGNIDVLGHIVGHNTPNLSGINSVTANTFYGSGANLTGISVDSTKIETGNTKVETIDTGSDGHIKVTTEGTERFRINSTGNVSIGGIDPVPTASYYNKASLHIHQTGSGSATGAQIHLTSDHTGSAAGDGSQLSIYSTSLYINNQENGSTYFYNNGSATATILANGNFGVGTQAPTDKLHVNGTALIGSNLYANNNVYLSSNKGIYFDGGTGSNNHLDDYEEGTWTPTLVSAPSGASIPTHTGYYTKVGNMCTIWLQGPTISGNNSSNNIVQIGGIPFSCASGFVATGIPRGYGVYRDSNHTWVTFLDSGNKIMWGQLDENVSWTQLKYSGLQNTSGHVTFQITLTYKTT